MVYPPQRNQPHQRPGEHGNRGPAGHSSGNRTESRVDCQSLSWLSPIRFTAPLDPQLFSEIAKRVAQEINESKKSANRPSQLRRFYDEIVLWEDKVRAAPDRFEEYRPFLLMMNAKAAYAQGRDVVSGEFVCLVQHTLAQVQDEKSLHLCKLFWESFMGFYKLERPKD
ncbi:type III-A CRISPR-associated protein Csm2 [Acidithiobacillus caldus]|jgi:CRISPR-associated protein Csm2|uniref:type III-A CRISPR-associated protein Csm2 n=1 Tax=Acidithiobacillus caldus TaxID=33059 RepID=UPI000983890B|nr:type III-A CRISPR-associated protein Csm2 [Acidithiobacillus caldus]